MTTQLIVQNLWVRYPTPARVVEAVRGVGFTLGREKLGMAAAGVMVVGSVVAAVWGLVGWWLGRRFEGPVSERAAPAAAQESKA